MKTAKEEFENLVYQGMKSYGLDELSSKMLAILHSEPDPLTLEELSTRTGYSFSAVSAAMKLLTGITLVEKTKKAGSKKLYFSVQKDMLTMTINAVKTKNEVFVGPALKDLPEIIERCKKNRSEDSEKILKLIEDYYQQMIALDLIFKNLTEYIEMIRMELGKK